jgi:hypothetical protein
MPKILISFTLVLTSCLTYGVPAFAQSVPSQPQSAKPKVVQPRVQRAEWNEQVKLFTGISQDEFAAMGLRKLTVDEYEKLFTWAFNRESEAKEAGKKEAMASQVTFSCGPKQTTDESVKKVHVLIEDTSAAAELMSGVRQKLRGISDVEIVYDISQADLVVIILGYENQLESGTRTTGYTASTVVASPCVGKIGTYEWNFQMSDDHFIFTVGPNIGVLVEKVVAKIDSSDIEPIRKSHAQWKAIQNKKN